MGYGGKLVVKDMLAAGQAATFAQVRQVVDQFCAQCHNAQMQNKGVALLTPELQCPHTQAVYQQAVVLRLAALAILVLKKGT